MTNSKELFQELVNKITGTPDREEAYAIVFHLLEQRVGITRQDVMMQRPVAVELSSFEEDITRINRYEPVQYVTEAAWFRNRLFVVRPGVLIPRPETELLVEEILKEINGSTHDAIVDVGTGSGCIALSLSLELPHATVVGIDISDVALKIAGENAKKLKASVTFQKADILQKTFPFRDLDFLVSNPPYIRESEKQAMEKNVLEYEPALALFVPDNDPLKFYRALAEKGMQSLKPGGKLMAEINAALGMEVVDLLKSYDYRSIELINDLDGKNRIIKAKR